jgi:hypothetical protein
VPANSTSHAHGDSDDHHDNPKSPCHHHIVHCGCSHSPIFPPGGAGFAPVPQIAHEFALAISRPNSQFTLTSTFHIPIS